MTTPNASLPEPLPGGAIFALALAAFASGISLRLTDALLPLFAHEFAISPSEAAAVITSFSIAYGLSQLFFGPVGDRFGKFRVIAWACVACAVTASLCGMAQGFAQLVAARLLAGATAAAIIPLSMAWIGDVVPYERRQPVLARFLIGQILGLSAGVFVGGFTADHLSWRVPFFGIGLGFVATSVALFALDRRLPALARGQSRAQGNALRSMVNEFSQVLARPWARIVLLSVFLEGGFLYGAFAFIATHLHQTFGLPLATAGGVVMLFGFGGLLFALASGWLVRRLGEVGLTSVGGLLLAASLFAVGDAGLLHRRRRLLHAAQHAADQRDADGAGTARCSSLGVRVVLLSRPGGGGGAGEPGGGALGHRRRDGDRRRRRAGGRARVQPLARDAGCVSRGLDRRALSGRHRLAGRDHRRPADDGRRPARGAAAAPGAHALRPRRVRCRAGRRAHRPARLSARKSSPSSAS